MRFRNLHRFIVIKTDYGIHINAMSNGYYDNSRWYDMNLLYHVNNTNHQYHINGNPVCSLVIRQPDNMILELIKNEIKSVDVHIERTNKIMRVGCIRTRYGNGYYRSYQYNLSNNKIKTIIYKMCDKSDIYKQHIYRFKL